MKYKKYIKKTHKWNYDIIPDTSSGVKPKQPNRKELLNLENGNATLPNNAQRSNHKETLSQEQRLNLENVKRIMNSEKTMLPSLRNIEWRTLKVETNKINQVLPNMSTNYIIEFKRTNLCWGEISMWENWDLLKEQEKKVKTRIRNSIGNADKNLRKKVKMIKYKKDTGIYGNGKEKRTREKITVQFEEIKQKVLAKEGRLKRYR